MGWWAPRVARASISTSPGADGEFADCVVDSYLVEIWPAAPALDSIVRVGSGEARYWHREVGGRR